MIFDSQMIIDHLDELAGAERSITPAAGAARRAVLRRTAMALGMAEKVVALRSELYRRAEEKRDADWAKRLEIQVLSALNWLEGCSAEPWLSGSAPGQDDVAAAVAALVAPSSGDGGEVGSMQHAESVALGDAIIALTANIAIKTGKKIEFKEEWFDIKSDEVPEDLMKKGTKTA